jgi:hypothetical protein
MREQGVLQSLSLVSGESMVLILDWRVSRCRSVWPERPKMVPPAQFRLQFTGSGLSRSSSMMASQRPVQWSQARKGRNYPGRVVRRSPVVRIRELEFGVSKIVAALIRGANFRDGLNRFFVKHGQ